MTLHVSLDLETLDTRASSVVVAIGAVMFDADKIYTSHPFYRKLQIEEQLRMGRTISESTLRWWMAQSDEARNSTFGGATRDFREVGDMFYELRAWTERQGVGLYGEPEYPKNPQGLERDPRPSDIVGWWTNGPSFDTAILESFGQRVPWKYNAARDFRTIMDFIPKGAWPAREGTFHNAFDDAVYQAQCIQAVWRKLTSDEHALYWAPDHEPAQPPAQGAETKPADSV